MTLAAAVILCSCGTLNQVGSSDGSQRFQDGIYGKAPSLKSKAEKETQTAQAEALAEKTKGSTIYLFGDKKDSVYIPKQMAAKISFNNELGTTVTVSDQDWRYDDRWAYYTPYSIGSSWYWSRHYDPWYWNSWSYRPWHYRGWYDPWYYNSWYGGWYDPWYYGGWHDPWFYTGWYYGGWYDPWYYGGWGHHGWW